MRYPFKHKPEYKLKLNNRKEEYLKKESVLYSSICNIEEDIVTTRNKVKGKIYQFSFQVPVGLSPDIDRYNKQCMKQLVSSCNGKLKFYLLSEQKRFLQDNMEMLKDRVKSLDEDNPLSDICANRYGIMDSLSKMTYSTVYVFVDESIYKFEELAGRFLNVYQLKGNDLLDFLERLNNDPMLGGEGYNVE